MPTKKAIDLMPGDRCTGPSVDFTDEGVVKNTIVVDEGVQINWEGGTYTVRSKDYELEVENMHNEQDAALEHVREIYDVQDERRLPDGRIRVEVTNGSTPFFFIDEEGVVLNEDGDGVNLDG